MRRRFLRFPSELLLTLLFGTAKRKISAMGVRRFSIFLVFLLIAWTGISLNGQDSSRRGRKYKAPPETSHIEVVVVKKATGKPVVNAAVIFRAVRNGKDDGNLEVKTDPDGKAIIDVIATGSLVRVQVIADGLSTFAEEYQVDEPSREIHIALLKPRAQISAYEDNSGKAADRKPGVQEPNPVSKPAAPPANTLQPRTTPPAGTPAPATPQQ